MDIDGIFYCSRCMRQLDEPGVCPFCGFDRAKAYRDTAVLEEGTLLKDRYLLGASIGRGGFGITYAAWDETLQVAVAIKEYFPMEIVERSTDESDDVHPLDEYIAEFKIGRERFIRESKVLAMLHEIPGIVQVLDCFEENGTCYIAMEYIHGVPLDRYVQNGGFRDGQILDLMRQPIEALIAMHRLGVLHRDISPDNIMVSEDGTVKLIDFGAAAQMERRQQGRDHTVVLKRKYAALEQHDTSLEQGPWTDVYDLCATLYMLLTGEPAPESLRRLRFDEIVPIGRTSAKLKRHQQRAIMQGLQVLPEKRIRSMGEFRSILYNIPFPDDVVRRRRIRQRMTALAAVLTAVTALIALNFTYGLPLGDGLVYSIRRDGAHVTHGIGLKGEIIIPDYVLGAPVTQLDRNVFARNNAVTGVELPGTMRAVQSSSFRGCSQLSWVRLNEGTVSIGDSAFIECTGLASVFMPNSIAEIGASVFDNVPEHMTIWCADGSAAEGYAIANGYGSCSYEDYTYRVENGSVVLTGYSGAMRSVKMPSIIDGMHVTAIDAAAAPDMLPDGIVSVSLPEYLREVPDGMFEDCESLNTVVFGATLESIGARAFINTSVTSIELPDTVKHIGASAFAYVEELEAVKLGRSLESIGDDAFRFTSFSDVTLPDSLRTIGAGAFFGSGLTSLKLPAYIESIGKNAFWGSDLVSVEFGFSTSVRQLMMGEGLFFGCTSLETAVLSANITSIPDSMFDGCERLHDINIPPSVISIGNSSFMGCESLEYVMLPEYLISIGDEAFGYCARLRTLYLPERVTGMGQYVFEGCHSGMLIIGSGSVARSIAEEQGFSYTDISDWAECYVDDAGALILADNRKGGDSDGMMPFMDKVVLPSIMGAENGAVTAVKTIDSVDRLNCRELVLPKYLDEIGERSFYGNVWVNRITAERLERISNQAFIGLSSLEHIDLPDGLTLIGDYAFKECSNLSSILLPDSLEVIGKEAFFGCSALEYVKLPGSLTYLPEKCFSMTGLKSVAVPGGVTTCHTAFTNCKELRIAAFENGCTAVLGAFYGCTALDTVVFPESIRSVGIETFVNCVSLEDVWVYGMETDLDCRDTVEYWALKREHLFSDSPDVTIHAYPGSLAESFAARYGIDFEPITDDDEPLGGAL